MLEYGHGPGHNCSKCGYVLDELACQTLDHLPDLETGFPKDTKMLHKDISCEKIAFYHHEYGSFSGKK